MHMVVYSVDCGRYVNPLTIEAQKGIGEPGGADLTSLIRRAVQPDWQALLKIADPGRWDVPRAGEGTRRASDGDGELPGVRVGRHTRCGRRADEPAGRRIDGHQHRSELDPRDDLTAGQLQATDRSVSAQVQHWVVPWELFHRLGQANSQRRYKRLLIDGRPRYARDTV